ncbi:MULTISPECIES: arginine decarboxylase [unclassified Streptomyces]|uniref:arginine decarboxylase n=1 Tax=unclassified Streptomyces TaxID=2593676 RepID=UPI0006FE9118|nr:MULTISPECIES: arginine decarboxylase [unclassified Streptomyces]KQX59348.1 arginine decarboxylase [Streptomyces sp. Root1304]KRB00609.1 arginine decarboxylase [Streptomyces sp. Root66D1]
MTASTSSTPEPAPLPARPGAYPDGRTTPLADAVLAVARRDIATFHALPLSHGRSIRDSHMRETYEALFGAAQLAADVSYSGTMLDSFFRPRGPLRDAQRLAARSFGADATFFLSAGTSTANRVALTALTQPGSRVLADRSCHQSVHFALNSLGVQVAYAPMQRCCDDCPRTYADLPRLLEMFRAAAVEGRPYDTVVLSAVSYDGVRYDLPTVLAELSAVHPTVSVLVDEAWGAAHRFHPRLRPLTALHAVEALRAADPRLAMNVAVTHSAHKSMSALRQGSYLHLIGDGEAAERTAQALFQHHTTSPSWPVLASLDLARLQAETEGEALLGRSLGLARTLRVELATDPRLSAYRPLGPDGHLTDPAQLVSDDPTRVLVDISALGITAADFRRMLFDEYALYVARESGDAVLFHIHIGVDEATLLRLLDALRTIQRTYRSASAALAAGTSEHFIIAYPPGIPITVPGEKLCERTLSQIDSLRSSGCEIYTLRNPTVSAGELAAQAAATGTLPSVPSIPALPSAASIASLPSVPPAPVSAQLAGAAAAVSAASTTAATVSAAANATAGAGATR